MTVVLQYVGTADEHVYDDGEVRVEFERNGVPQPVSDSVAKRLLAADDFLVVEGGDCPDEDNETPDTEDTPGVGDYWDEDEDDEQGEPESKPFTSSWFGDR